MPKSHEQKKSSDKPVLAKINQEKKASLRIRTGVKAGARMQW